MFGCPMPRTMQARAIVNARVHPMIRPTSRARAVLWAEGRIVMAGSEAEVRREARAHGARITDGDGRVVLPGFVDGHLHLLHVGLERARCQLHGTSSLKEALDRTRAWLRRHPGDDPVIVEGWDEGEWQGDPPPRRSDLDTLEPHRPLVLRRVCGHKAVANTPALENVLERWDEGRLVDRASGVLLEDASLFLAEVLPVPEATMEEALRRATRKAHRLGVTSVGEYAQAPFRRTVQRAAAAGTLGLRITQSVYPHQTPMELAQGFRTGRAATGPGGTRSPWLRDGAAKLFLDGSIGGRTALMRKPYRDGGHGHRFWDDGALLQHMRHAHDAGVQVHAHAIGDAAVDQGLDAFSGLATAAGGWDRADRPRHRFEHFEVVHDEQAARAAGLQIHACVQPNFAGAWMARGGIYEARIGQRRRLANRFATWRRTGVEYSFGSDGMPFGPLEGIQAALDHPVRSERIGIQEALWRYTHMAAWGLHWEDQVGALAPGRHADLVVMDVRSLAQRPPRTWQVLETISAGSTVFRHPTEQNPNGTPTPRTPA